MVTADEARRELARRELARRSQGGGQAAAPADAGGYGSQAASGWFEGATGALGAPVDLVNNFLVAPAFKGINAAFGTDLQPSAEPLGGSAGLRRGLAIAPPSEDTGKQMTRRVMQSVGGASVPLAGTANTVGQAAAGLGTAAGGGLGGAFAQWAFPDNLGAEIAGEMIGGLGTGAAIGGLADRASRRAAEKAVPSIEELKGRASKLYRQAEARGVVAGPTETQRLAGDITDIARRNELITPTGRVSTAYPKAKEALNLFSDYSGHEMNPTQMQVIRDTLSDAARTTEGKESRIATQMLKAFDDFSMPLAPELRQARGVSQQYIKGDQLETMRKLAENSQHNYTQSGFDNALRQQYKKLSDDIIKGREVGWSPAQVEAINRVANGTPLSRTMTHAGKFAPKGVVSFGMGTIGPAALAHATLGPAAGALVGLGLPMGGFAAQSAASSLRSGYARAAELATRNGGPVVTSSTDALRRRIIEALVGSQAAVQSTPTR